MQTPVSFFRVIPQFYRAEWLQMLKSPKNVVFSFLLQLIYYITQGLFWFGVATPANSSTFDSKSVTAFLVVVALIDNTYLTFLGPGSMNAQRLIVSRNLEPYLLWPRRALFLLAFSKPNLAYLPCFFLSVIALAIYAVKVEISGLRMAYFLLAAMQGVLVLSGISFLYRMTTFWTSSVVRIRHSNPSFKIMVRPYESFQGWLRLVLLTIFPALYITGIPTQILEGEFTFHWLGYGLMITCLLWLSVLSIWTLGVRRYGKYVT